MTAPLNIILVNLGYSDFGCYGPKPNSTLIWTKWRKRGRASPIFSMAPLVCSPFRGAMLTDCYPPKDDFGKVINQTGTSGGFVRGAFDTKEPVGKVENGISGDKLSTPVTLQTFSWLAVTKGGYSRLKRKRSIQFSRAKRITRF